MMLPGRIKSTLTNLLKTIRNGRVKPIYEKLIGRRSNGSNIRLVGLIERKCLPFEAYLSSSPSCRRIFALSSKQPQKRSAKVVSVVGHYPCPLDINGPIPSVAVIVQSHLCRVKCWFRKKVTCEKIHQLMRPHRRSFF